MLKINMVCSNCPLGRFVPPPPSHSVDFSALEHSVLRVWKINFFLENVVFYISVCTTILLVYTTRNVRMYLKSTVYMYVPKQANVPPHLD